MFLGGEGKITNSCSEDICNPNLGIKMCPLCDHWCGYYDLQETCTHARITYLFDNGTTVFFAIFMSFWGKKSSHFMAVLPCDPFSHFYT